MDTVNRFTLIIRPKQDFLDWVNKVNTSNVFYGPHLIEGHDSADVYLIPQYESYGEVLHWLKQNYEDILTVFLEEWCEDVKLWPRPLTFEVFEDFVDWEYHSVLIDMVDDEPLDYEDDYE